MFFFLKLFLINFLILSCQTRTNNVTKKRQTTLDPNKKTQTNNISSDEQLSLIQEFPVREKVAAKKLKITNITSSKLDISNFQGTQIYFTYSDEADYVFYTICPLESKKDSSDCESFKTYENALHWQLKEGLYKIYAKACIFEERKIDSSCGKESEEMFSQDGPKDLDSKLAQLLSEENKLTNEIKNFAFKIRDLLLKYKKTKNSDEKNIEAQKFETLIDNQLSMGPYLIGEFIATEDALTNLENSLDQALSSNNKDAFQLAADSNSPKKEVTQSKKDKNGAALLSLGILSTAGGAGIWAASTAASTKNAASFKSKVEVVAKNTAANIGVRGGQSKLNAFMKKFGLKSDSAFKLPENVTQKTFKTQGEKITGVTEAGQFRIESYAFMAVGAVAIVMGIYYLATNLSDNAMQTLKDDLEPLAKQLQALRVQRQKITEEINKFLSP